VVNLLGERVAHCYAPYDFRDAVDRFFDRVRPRLLVLMETELWPNMLEAARSRGTPVLLVNARLSERSARGYARVGALTARMLDSLKFVACQYPDHVQRFVNLGADAERVAALGSVKFDIELPEDHAVRCAELQTRWRLGDRPVWIAASTHPGEEEQVLEAHGSVRAVCPDALLILVPRHPNRRQEVSELIERSGFSYGRMSDGDELAAVDVILGDTMGRLLYLYGLSQVAFVGGSLIQHGGHNPIEAAVCAQPVLMGPQLYNFPDVAAAFQAAGCLAVVGDAAALAREVIRYLTESDQRRAAADTALEVVSANRGATDRLLALLERELGGL
jgi:3-deoxy-D-manno-octulosonic-acid transferase